MANVNAPFGLLPTMLKRISRSWIKPRAPIWRLFLCMHFETTNIRRVGRITHDGNGHSTAAAHSRGSSL